MPDWVNDLAKQGISSLVTAAIPSATNQNYSNYPSSTHRSLRIFGWSRLSLLSSVVSLSMVWLSPRPA